jgi:chemotaxis protein MotB
MNKKTEFQDYEPEVSNTQSMWVLSYCDLLCQLICFFVLLFASATVKKQEWEKIRTSFAQRLDPTKDAKNSKPAAEISIEKAFNIDAQNLGYLKNILREKIMSNAALKDQVILQETDDRLVISITGDSSFLRGSTKITPQLETTLAILGNILHNTYNRVEIHGNADPNPISGKSFPSNWELSLTRAQAVGNYLRDNGYPYHLSVYGRGDSAYSGLPEGLSAKQRERLSRRIDIIIRADRAEAHT